MIQHTWRIHSLTKETVSGVDDVVVNITWEKIGIEKETGYIGSVKRQTIFTEDQLKTDSFVPYEQLTEKVVLEWIESTVNQNQLNNIIEQEIQKRKSNRTHVEEENLPWVNKEE